MAGALWQSIDLQAADGGLDSCFKVARVAESLIKNIKEVQMIESLRDFADTYMEKEKDNTDKLDAIWKADAATKDIPVARGGS